jgi:sugar-specific transcriptional regulator TrmB
MENQHKNLTLTRLGLTSNQAKVYLALFRSGLSNAKGISKNSGVARSDVYRVMASLEKLGLVEKIISVPCKFRAISIQDAFAILMERRKKVTSELHVTTREILKQFKSNNARTALKEDETQFSLLSERVTVQRREKTLESVHQSFDVVSSFRNPHSVLFTDSEEMAEALQRDVEIRVIIDKPDEEKILSDTLKQLKKHPNFKIKYLPNAPKALISIYDKKKAWVCTCTNPALKACPTLRTNNPCLLAILQDYFETKWLTALTSKPEQPCPPSPT